MSDDITGELQFDRVETASHQDASTGAACTLCLTPITSEYYDINQQVVCSSCRDTVAEATVTPTGASPLLRAAGLGLIGAILGAVPYWAVLALANLEIGILSIVSGYFVGLGVRRGAGGRGGRRFQVMAALLTYASIALAYAPVAVQGFRAADQKRERAVSTSAVPREAPQPAREGSAAPGERPQVQAAAVGSPSVAGLLIGLGFIVALLMALPLILIVTTLPSGLLSAIILGVGMRQAWQLTGKPQLTVLGPYRVSATTPTAQP